MLTILKLFGRSPFSPLLSHMEKVSACIHKLPELFDALKAEDKEQIEKLAQEISKLEHKADLTKNDIRNHLPKSLFLQIDRSDLLEILTLQDSIADKAEDIAIATTLKPLKMLSLFEEPFNRFLNKNIETFIQAKAIIEEMNSLVESSFGGAEAEKVRKMIEETAFKEHEADLIQRELLKKVLSAEESMTYTTFYVWQNLIQAIADISNLSEKLAWRVCRTLELK
jgi:uncharacterized protein